MLYTISNTISGANLGAYSGDSEADALEAMAQAAGYPTYAEACAVAPSEPGEILVEPVAQFILNAAGQRVVDRFVTERAKDGCEPSAWYADAEAAANDAFHRDMAAVIEISSAMSRSGRPETQVLDMDLFDAMPE